MYARVTKYKMKPGAMDGATAMNEQLKPKIMGLPGMIQFLNVGNDDGTGYVISIVESQEISEANADKVKALWAEMGAFLEEPPVPEGYDVRFNWSA
ncbi:hypothetical protein [Ovoidimarina sediminis]|uniref:hypothetical protein n=1 Tax=Ovoidimarina sediminis TaxID=3079856 RepID=UPI00290EA7A1|nr:hypothetical protein [Rhodophyticola sp. MJ-SS7]MDU8942643.1 hypothetical protein [Rhodophyticola sp. MJ-SS7]